MTGRAGTEHRRWFGALNERDVPVVLSATPTSTFALYRISSNGSVAPT